MTCSRAEHRVRYLRAVWVKIAIAVGLCALSLGAVGCGSRDSASSTDSSAAATTGGGGGEGGGSCVPRQGEPVGLDDASTVGAGKATPIDFPALDASAELRVTGTHQVKSLKTPDGTIDAGGGVSRSSILVHDKGSSSASPLSILADRLLVESADGEFWKTVTPTQGCHGANAAAASLSGKSDVKVATIVVKAGTKVRTSLAYPIAQHSNGPFTWTASASPAAKPWSSRPTEAGGCSESNTGSRALSSGGSRASEPAGRIPTAKPP